jgi:hypothetical protein
MRKYRVTTAAMAFGRTHRGEFYVNAVHPDAARSTAQSLAVVSVGRAGVEFIDVAVTDCAVVG